VKALLRKEFRENVKLAALGLVIYTLLIVQQCRHFMLPERATAQPLVGSDFLTFTSWFCGIFGAVLGWVQIHNERRPDLWAFLIHRPIRRTSIFLAKAIAGLSLYALATCLPLLGFTVWARWPGHVGAPFEPLMLRPAATFILVGTVACFAGMLTGLRQARWYASRALGLALALVAVLQLRGTPEFWQSLAILFVAAAILITVAWGAFQTDGHYEGQPAWCKAALTGTVLVGTLAVVLAVAGFLGTWVPGPHVAEQLSNYEMTTNGAVYKLTTTVDRSPETTRLVAEPVLGAKAGLITNRVEIQELQARGTWFNLSRDDQDSNSLWMDRDCNLFSLWRESANTVWFYWDHLGRLVGYNRVTRRLIGSLGPSGFARTISGDGSRFNKVSRGANARTLATATTVFLVDVEQRTTKPLFTTPEDDPVLDVHEVKAKDPDQEYIAVATRKLIYRLTREGKTVWKIPYELPSPSYRDIRLYFLEPPGRFALWMAPSVWAQSEAKQALPTHVVWLASDQGVMKTADLPPLPVGHVEPPRWETLAACVLPPGLLVPAGLSVPDSGPQGLTRTLVWLNVGLAALLCLSVGWWLGRRYRFSLAAQAGWAVFHLLFGVPGLLTFLSVQEWPAREACPNCHKLRVVDRAQCEHCGAGFAPPEKTGTEVFAPLAVSIQLNRR
jgi:NADH:ubiquinone oxidoreductase subunit 6 (subunit J)